ncbi:protein FAM3C isoform X2 [Antennarius striatus]|uniref:protein FAM3C isoform X2 n=1 Tax=Antennarius striatus TaxID=241820 RepID=UPI0035B2FA3B
MKCRATFNICAIMVILLITWGLSSKSFDRWQKARQFLVSVTIAPEPKCSLSRVCLPDRFALNIRSGAANVVGPKICFEGKIIMSHVLNNVRPGLNIVVVNDESGDVENVDSLNMKNGNTEEILEYLRNIKPGMIVLAASFGDVTQVLTDEIREVFVGMGSTLIEAVKSRDGWVFAGRAGAQNKSLYEKHAVSNKETNIYEGWPGIVEIGGCFPKTLTGGLNL